MRGWQAGTWKWLRGEAAAMATLREQRGIALIEDWDGKLRSPLKLFGPVPVTANEAGGHRSVLASVLGRSTKEIHFRVSSGPDPHFGTVFVIMALTILNRRVLCWKGTLLYPVFRTLKW